VVEKIKKQLWILQRVIQHWTNRGLRTRQSANNLVGDAVQVALLAFGLDACLVAALLAGRAAGSPTTGDRGTTAGVSVAPGPCGA
jgi:hypothetical protein